MAARILIVDDDPVQRRLLDNMVRKFGHEPAYDVWEKSKHAHAYEALVKATRPALRQYDGECIVCHTVGFAYESGFKNERATPHLKNVGCESCHGPASEHVKDPKQAQSICSLRAMATFAIFPVAGQGEKNVLRHA